MLGVAVVVTWPLAATVVRRRPRIPRRRLTFVVRGAAVVCGAAAALGAAGAAGAVALAVATPPALPVAAVPLGLVRLLVAASAAGVGTSDVVGAAVVVV